MVNPDLGITVFEHEGHPEALVRVRIDSSTKGGTQITKLWEFAMKKTGADWKINEIYEKWIGALLGDHAMTEEYELIGASVGDLKNEAFVVEGTIEIDGGVVRGELNWTLVNGGTDDFFARKLEQSRVLSATEQVSGTIRGNSLNMNGSATRNSDNIIAQRSSYFLELLENRQFFDGNFITDERMYGAGRLLGVIRRRGVKA
jgi:hypothetical protein